MQHDIPQEVSSCPVVIFLVACKARPPRIGDSIACVVMNANLRRWRGRDCALRICGGYAMSNGFAPLHSMQHALKRVYYTVTHHVAASRIQLNKSHIKVRTIDQLLERTFSSPSTTWVAFLSNESHPICIHSPSPAPNLATASLNTFVNCQFR